MAEFNHNSHIKGSEGELWLIQKPTASLSLTRLSKAMPAPTGVLPGNYHLQYSLIGPIPPTANVPPLYLTNNGEGKQLTVEKPTGLPNQEWSIQPPLGENIDSEYRIIVPAQSKDFIASAVSQDVVQKPDEVSLIKNLQVWNFSSVGGNDKLVDNLYEIRSNLYGHLIGSNPLLGADKDNKVVIDHVPVIPFPPKPVWGLISAGPLK